MNKSLKIAIAAVVAIAAAAWLAFGFFGIQAAFIDDEVSEANPFGDVVTAPQVESETSAVVAAPAAPVAGVSTESADGKQREPDTSQAAAAPESAQPANEVAASDPDPATDAEPDAADEAQAAATPQITTLATGSLVDHAHAGDGTINVLTDGTQRFLRFEDDFAIDNGPDLNVYLVRGVDAEGPAGLFDDDFIDLGDLKGNVGAQNYELDSTIDLSEYDTVVIWCVRFGVAFNAADLG